MATMVKEKRREKKKTKIKQLPEIESNVKENPESPLLSDISSKGKDIPSIHVIQEQASNSSINEEQSISTTHNKQETQVPTHAIEETNKQVASIVDTVQEKHLPSSCEGRKESQAEETTSEVSKVKDIITKENKPFEQDNSITNNLQNILTEAKKSLNEIMLDEYSVTNSKANTVTRDFNKIQKVTLGSSELEIGFKKISLDSMNIPDLESQQEIVLKEDSRPSAPLARTEVEAQPYISGVTRERVVEKARLSCMPLEEAVRVFGGREIAEVKALSEREEAAVEAGPQGGPDHPLVDLLSTFRTALIAIERERNRISSGYVEEEKSQATLWLVEKRNIYQTRACRCSALVRIRAEYEVARLQTEKMPAAKLRLEALLRDVQECYCHHQHAALQAHYDVDELVAEILQSNKSSVRSALLLVLQALQLSDAAPETFAAALQRWASVLASSLLDDRDLGHLLFLLHSLFRQSRSVQWAGRVVELQVRDMPSAARLVAILELLLTRPLLEEAQECTEGKFSVQWAGRVVELQVRDMPSAARLVAILELLLTRPLLEEAQECTEGKFSVQWAGRVVELQVRDMPSAARLVAILELLLTRPLLEEAQECTEGKFSVQWAGRVVELQVRDMPSAARLVAILELLLTRPLLEEAQECTEGKFSVQWAGRVVELQVRDMPSAARLVAILELLLTRPLLEEAQECTEGKFSVQWAGRVVELQVRDMPSAARLVAILELLLTSRRGAS
ncbi:uncharacterized protein [Maniola hyperantus]|uniref:uncharacterized protein n=1 Tax=Aphantopus hyperantus TaxID=2795564 RepID=UPI003749F29C